MSRVKAYVGCALTNSPQEFKDSIDLFKSKLRNYIEVLDFMGLKSPSAQVAFEWDIKHVRNADVLISDFTHVSLGGELNGELQCK